MNWGIPVHELGPELQQKYWKVHRQTGSLFDEK